MIHRLLQWLSRQCYSMPLRAPAAHSLSRAFLVASMFVGASFAESKPYERIVSVGGALTEIIYALGEQDRIVAVDTSSIYPRETQALPRVGYQRTLSAEGVLSSQPDLVLATDAAGPQAVLQQLQGAGVELVAIPTVHSLQGLLEKIRDVSMLLGVEPKGQSLIASMTEQMASVETRIAADTAPKTRVVFLLNVGKGPLMVAGRETAADAVITLSGGQNVMGDSFEGYKPVSAEAMIAAGPEVILVTHRTQTALGDEGLLEVPGLSLTPAGREKRIVAMDGLLLLGFTPRLPDAVGMLHDYIHNKL
ncbi:MAG TPA: hemin ABC transporter substrate-binding protein [Gammaproteobacteria bacterium]|nr:hemin ABC transporter substrate-binding protein [Gammaproteobacteria bacterium]